MDKTVIVVDNYEFLTLSTSLSTTVKSLEKFVEVYIKLKENIYFYSIFLPFIKMPIGEFMP